MAFVTSTGKIDIHSSKRDYYAKLEKFRHDKTVGQENRQHILDFLRACSLGKTIQKRAKKKIKERRLLKYLNLLPRISVWFGKKDFNIITMAEMEDFISRLENNLLYLRKKGVLQPVTYSPNSQKDYKVTLKKFYKYLHGHNEIYPKLVSWIDTHVEERTPPCLAIDQIRKCVEYSSTLRNKALIWTLFETGARSEEFLNIRLKHVTDKNTHLIVSIEYPKTYKRSLPIHEGADLLRNWLENHPYKNDPDTQLFPITYDAMRLFFSRLGIRVLGRSINPHLLRNSFASWLASKKIGRYQMCKLMGWAMASNMPDRYIDRNGVVEEEAIASIRGDNLVQAQNENKSIKESFARLQAEYDQMKEHVIKHKKIDDLLNSLIKDKEVAHLLVEKIKSKALSKSLMAL